MGRMLHTIYPCVNNFLHGKNGLVTASAALCPWDLPNGSSWWTEGRWRHLNRFQNGGKYRVGLGATVELLGRLNRLSMSPGRVLEALWAQEHALHNGGACCQMGGHL